MNCASIAEEKIELEAGVPPPRISIVLDCTELDDGVPPPRMSIVELKTALLAGPGSGVKSSAISPLNAVDGMTTNAVEISPLRATRQRLP